MYSNWRPKSLNAAGHLANVYRGQCYHRFFNAITESGFHHCHWVVQDEGVRSFWGVQASSIYQDEQLFIGDDLASTVVDGKVIDNPFVNESSDPGLHYMNTTNA
jgi:hypothetical protein